jgi:hypothetical protein
MDWKLVCNFFDLKNIGLLVLSSVLLYMVVLLSDVYTIPESWNPGVTAYLEIAQTNPTQRFLKIW